MFGLSLFRYRRYEVATHARFDSSSFFCPCSVIKSLGPRIQGLIDGVTNGPLLSAANLASIFRDEYDITYVDGTSSKWHILAVSFVIEIQ